MFPGNMFPLGDFYQNYEKPYQNPLNFYHYGVQDQTAMAAAILASQYQYQYQYQQQLQMQQLHQLQMQQEPQQQQLNPLLSNAMLPPFMLQPPSHYQIPSPGQLERQLQLQQPPLQKRDQDELVCNISPGDEASRNAPIDDGNGVVIARPAAKRSRPKKFSCPLCWVKLSNVGQFNGHIRIHTGERPFRCDYATCGKSFTRNEELTRHKRIHTGMRPFKCIKCQKCFGRKDHLKKHLKTHDKHDNSLNVTGQSAIELESGQILAVQEACRGLREENDIGCMAGVLDVQYETKPPGPQAITPDGAQMF